MGRLQSYALIGVLASTFVACGAEQLKLRKSQDGDQNDESAELDLTNKEVRTLKHRFASSKGDFKRLGEMLDDIDVICDRVELYNKDVKEALGSISAETKVLVDKIAKLKESLSGYQLQIRDVDGKIAVNQGAIQAKETLIKEGPEAAVIAATHALIAAARKAIAKDRKEIRAIERKMLRLPEPEVYEALSDQRDALEADVAKQKKIVVDGLYALNRARKLSVSEIAALKLEIGALQAVIVQFQIHRGVIALERAKVRRELVSAKAELTRIGGQDDVIGAPFDLPKQCSDDDIKPVPTVDDPSTQKSPDPSPPNLN